MKILVNKTYHPSITLQFHKYLAAESHVDNSIKNPLGFAQTNVIGTLNLLEAARSQWRDDLVNKRFYHISTDEVFGSFGKKGAFTEETAYDPRSPIRLKRLHQIIL